MNFLVARGPVFKETKLLALKNRVQVRIEDGHMIHLLEAICFFILATGVATRENGGGF